MSATSIDLPAHATSPALPFTGPWMLAPMEGVTEPCFRDVVIQRNRPDELGGAFTEFVRVVHQPISRKKLLQHLGPTRFETPVGLQIMGSDIEAVAETAHRAAEVGAPVIDLNFGCPSKGALRSCAGSAMLDDPASIERLVGAVRTAIPNTPLCAKIRAGGDDDRLLEELALAAEAGGAQLLTIHCRTRAEAYGDTADWQRLARAVAVLEIPVCGNGGISVHADLERMRSATGCQFAMVGRAALGNPWIFGDHQASRADALEFLLAYGELLLSQSDRSIQLVCSRIKQLIRHWTAGELVDDRTRLTWLRQPNGKGFMGYLHEQAERARSNKVPNSQAS